MDPGAGASMIVLGGDYEHTQGFNSSVGSGVPLEYQPRVITDLYRMILSRGSFEASEFSLSNLAMYRDKGDDWLAAIPVFPSRVFRHSCVFVPKDSPLQSFADLRGKRVGVIEYTMTAAVWVRGHMLEDFGIHWSDVEWISGASRRFPPPEAAKVAQTATDLEELLLKGEIDALLMPKPKDLAKPLRERRLRHIFPDVRSVEAGFFDRTGLFPIMHTAVIRKEALAANPWAPHAIFETYARAKAMALKRRLGTTMLPWADMHWDGVMDRFGDPLPYGLTSLNRRNIETLGRFLLEQQLISSPVRVDDMFVAGAGEWLEAPH